MSGELGKVALFLPNLGGGGAERMMVNLAFGLQGRGVPVELVLAAARGPYLAEVSEELSVVDLGAKSVLQSIPALTRYLRQVRPEVLVATLKYANLAALWARRLAGVGTRVYLREANMLSVGARPSPKSQFILELVKRCYPWADGVIAVSKGVEEDVRAFVGLPESKTCTIYNPVVSDAIFARSLEPVAHPWFLAETPVVLGVGRLTRQKDFATLVRAFAQVRREREAKLVILGEGEDRSALQALIQELGLSEDAVLPGFVDNPFAYMARASVFVLSSLWEGLPGVLIQALACGCPAVSTDCPSGPAEILEGGRYGRLVPIADAERMARAILETLESPGEREALVRRAGDFSLEVSTDEYIAFMGLA